MSEYDVIGKILEYPWELREYLQRKPATNSSGAGVESLFSSLESKRFSLRIRDKPVLAGNCHSGDYKLNSIGFDRYICGLSSINVDIARSILEQCNGTHTVADLGRMAEDREQVNVLLNSCLNELIVVPDVISNYESKIRGVEVSRLPLGAYFIDRNYWQNMADLRSSLPILEDPKVTGQELKNIFRRFHIIATMGSDLDCFYKPHDNIQPGNFSLYQPYVAKFSEVSMYSTFTCVFFGEENLDQLLVNYKDEEGLEWGYSKRTREYNKYGRMFFGARPLTDQHFDSLALDLSHINEALVNSNTDQLILKLAVFHQKFVRLHLFSYVNQSIVMNIVNYFLLKGTGTIIPHLALDVLALELSTTSYLKVFKNAVDVYGVAWDKKGAYDTFGNIAGKLGVALDHLLQLSGSRKEIVAYLKDNPDEARLLLLTA